VLIDDMVSSGATLMATIEQLQALAPASLRVMAVHALFSEQVLAQLYDAGAVEVISCDSVIHTTNRIELAGLLSTALADIS
jgi:ribose-phosphate pyrophosphokinase